MEKPFEVGEIVFYRPAWAWSKITETRAYSDTGGQYAVKLEDTEGLVSVLSVTRDPIIPPKPKKMVTKQVIAGRDWGDAQYIVPLCTHSCVPLKATNIRILYDIEE